jgi:hypothetical protein
VWIRPGPRGAGTSRLLGRDSPSPLSPPSDSYVDCAATISVRLALRRARSRSTSLTVNGMPGNRLGRPAHVGMLPITHSPVICVISVSLFAGGELLIEFLNGGLGPHGAIWVSDCRAEPAVVHGYAHRLLVFDLPDQLALRMTQRAGDIRVLGDRYAAEGQAGLYAI